MAQSVCERTFAGARDNDEDAKRCYACRDLDSRAISLETTCKSMLARGAVEALN
jgi:hypothetical protein